MVVARSSYSKEQGAAALSLVQQPLVVWDDLKCPLRCSEPRFHREKLLTTEAAPSVKMRLSRPAGRDKREISIEVLLKNGQSEAETIQIVLLFI